MGEFARSAALVLLLIGAYLFGRHDGESIRAKLALAESARVVAELSAAKLTLLESERRIEELQQSAAAAGTQTRTIIRTAKDLAAVPVPDDVAAGLRAQMARTQRAGPTGSGRGRSGGKRRADPVQ